MSRLIRDTDTIRKLSNLIDAIESEPWNARYDKAGLLKIVNAIIVAVNGIDEAYDVEAVVRELEHGPELIVGDAIFKGTYLKKSQVIEIVKRGGRNE